MLTLEQLDKKDADIYGNLQNEHKESFPEYEKIKTSGSEKNY